MASRLNPYISFDGDAYVDHPAFGAALIGLSAATLVINGAVFRVTLAPVRRLRHVEPSHGPHHGSRTGAAFIGTRTGRWPAG